jgi:threonine/homoserine/homoserine lactone efflux protein
MLDLFGFGFAAGLALAIPLGPMAIMLINTTMSRGWRHGVIGALAMASVDFSYALLVFLVGALIASFLSTWGVLLSLAGAAILLALGTQTLVRNLRLLNKPEHLGGQSAVEGSVGKTFSTFVGATVLNPPTALYFLAIAPTVSSLSGDSGFAPAVIFAGGVFIGSIIWQEGLALAGLGLRRLTSNKVRAILGSIGGALIIALAVSIAMRGLSA